MSNTRGNAHLAEQGQDTFLLDATDYEMTQAATERSDAWKAADAARARANDAAEQAAKAREEADDLERKAIAADDGVEHQKADPTAGTWEGTVSGGTSATETESSDESEADGE